VEEVEPTMDASGAEVIDDAVGDEEMDAE
jgi:hypothetical protein